MISVSIVSHGHGLMMHELLAALGRASLEADLDIILTINCPSLESAAWLASLEEMREIRTVMNAQPKGFAENHNRAAALARGEYFCVLNPDVSTLDSHDSSHAWQHVLRSLQEAASLPSVGLAYPAQLDAQGMPQDFERQLVTPWQIFRRYIWVKPAKQITSIDWVSGACMMFRSGVYKQIGGFDQRYRMYCEDVDICLRLQLAGYALSKAPCGLLHHTQRNTMKSPRHLAWHLHSFLKIWCSSAFWRYLRQHSR